MECIKSAQGKFFRQTATVCRKTLVETSFPASFRFETVTDMSKFSSIFVALSLLSFTHARSITYRDWPAHRDHCLSDSEAASLVATLESFYVRIDPVLAAKTLTPDYEELSYSTLRPGPGKIPVSTFLARVQKMMLTHSNSPVTLSRQTEPNLSRKRKRGAVVVCRFKHSMSGKSQRRPQR